jgi:hypothetical protein
MKFWHGREASNVRFSAATAADWTSAKALKTTRLTHSGIVRHPAPQSQSRCSTNSAGEIRGGNHSGPLCKIKKLLIMRFLHGAINAEMIAKEPRLIWIFGIVSAVLARDFSAARFRR